MKSAAFGLSTQILADLHRLFSRFPEIDKVLIYGSRAKETNKPYSDIDLAVIAPGMSPERFTLLWSKLEDLGLVFKLDVVHFDELENQTLKANIKTTGKVLYPQTTAQAYNKVLAKMSFGELREEIYNRFHDPIDQRFRKHIRTDRDRYAAYYTSMYLLADCYESTDEVIRKGFNVNPYLGYIEVWGFLQAIFISQDALRELYQAVCQTKLSTTNLKCWQQIRDYRNEIAGHPANRKDRYRSFFGRQHHDIERFRYERFDARTGKRQNPTLNLKEMRNDYFEKDGARVLRDVIRCIDSRIRNDSVNPELSEGRPL